MRSLATNANNDLFLTSGLLTLTTPGVQTVQQDAQHAMQAQLGEESLNLPGGVPTLETIWDNWNPAQFEAYARRVLLTVNNVSAVKEFNIVRLNGVATYRALLKTDFGMVPVTGTLVQPATGGY